MREILFRGDDYIFSYRVAGLLIQNGKLLMQGAGDDPALALPGGHVEIGETSRQALVREFGEELGVEVEVGKLKWVGEIYWSWDGKPCHQIGLYYEVFLSDGARLPQTASFGGHETIGGANVVIGFHWVPLTELGVIEVYPAFLPWLMEHWDRGIQHFVERN